MHRHALEASKPCELYLLQERDVRLLLAHPIKSRLVLLAVTARVEAAAHVPRDNLHEASFSDARLLDSQNPLISRANSRYRQKVFASAICRSELQRTSNSAGFATKNAAHRAREIATLKRFALYKNSMPRGAFSGEDVAIV